MMSKILAVGVLAITFTFAGNACAIGQNNDSETGNQVQQQTQTVNQGVNNQIKTQTQQQLQDGSGEGAQVQNQNQTQNQGEASQIRNSEQVGTQSQNKSGSATAQQRRSQVANAVQEMLQVADRNSEIGQQVRIIAQTQNQNQEKLEVSLQKVQSRSGFAKFLIGPNYGEINNAKKSLGQNREQIEQLNQAASQIANQGDHQILTEQIQLLEQANLEIENSLNVSEKGFSLFGWMFRLFAK